MRESPHIHFNGVNPLTGALLVPPMDARAAGDLALSAAGPAPTEEVASFRTGFGVDPNDLAQAGWGIVYPAPRSTAHRRRLVAIREALKPLVELRRAQASALRETRFRELWDDEGYRLGESKGRFLVQRGAAEAGAPVPDELPYYLLLIGPPTEIPFDFQYELDVAYAVGRLDLPSSDAYAAYAQRVVAAERGEIGRAPGAGFWGPATQGDLATQLSSRFLLPPLADALTGHPVARLVGDAGSKAALRRLMGPEGPALLMTASHGAYVPRAADPAKHEAWAGALVTGDWVGQGPVGPDALLTAEDIAADDDLAGLVSVHFACFGAGTPRHDGFGLYRGKRVQRGQRDGVPQLPPELAAQPFSAPLIRKMLGHPRGSLAAIGHVDVSFASAFLRPGEQASHAGQLEPYRSLLAALMAGERVGRAMDWMHEKAADLAHGLAGQIHQVNENLASLDDPLRHTLADQWLKTLDARSYVVHGDPAVRLAHRDPARGPRESTPLTLVSPPPARDTPTDEIPTDVEFGFFDGGVGGKLKALGERVAGWLGQQLDDLGNLEVKTWSSPAEGLDPDAPRRLRAMTRIGLYGDAEVVVPERPDGTVDSELWQIHLETVKEAQAQRSEIVRLLLTFVPGARPDRSGKR